VLAERRLPAHRLVTEHWARYGRNFYARHDYEGIPSDRADELMRRLRDQIPRLHGQSFGAFTIETADDFSYTDPVDGSTSAHQGVRLGLSGGSRIVYRLSGTGTEGATLRVYLERFEPDPRHHAQPIAAALAPLVPIAVGVADIVGITGRNEPSIIA